MQEKLSALIASAIHELYGLDIDPEIDRPEVQFGDYSTNVALKINKQLEKPPAEIAMALTEKLGGSDFIAEVSVAGPGFINFKLSTAAIVGQAKEPLKKTLENKVVVA